MGKWVSLGRYSDEELVVVKSILEGSGIQYLINLKDNSEVLRLYTSGGGYMGTEVLVEDKDYEKAREVLDS